MNKDAAITLRTSTERCAQLWRQHLQDATVPTADPATCRRACRAFLDMIPEAVGDLPDTARFTAEARAHDPRGVSHRQFVCAFRLLVQSCAEILAESGLDSARTTAALLELQRLADHLQGALLADREQSTIETIAGLEETRRRLEIENHKYARIYRETDNIILIADHDGRILEANPRAAETFASRPVPGRFCGELLNLDAATLPELIAGCAPDQAREVTLRTEDHHRHVYTLRILPLNPDTPRSPVMLLLHDITPLADQRHTLEARVTEHARAQLRVEKKHRALFNGVGEGILLIDEDHEITNANAQAAEIFGRPVPNLVGCPVCALTDEAGEHAFSECFASLPEGERSRREITGIYVDGRTFPTRATITRIDLDGNASWLLIIQDNSDQKGLEQRLRAEKHQSEEMNVTLRTVLHSIEQERGDAERRIAEKISTTILPALHKLKREDDAAARGCYLKLVTEQLTGLTAGTDAELDAGLLRLSPTEIEVCRMIRSGSSSKEICDAMHLSFETIQTHRKNIRRKLDLRGSKTSLRAYLSGRPHLGGSDA